MVAVALRFGLYISFPASSPARGNSIFYLFLPSDLSGSLIGSVREFGYGPMEAQRVYSKRFKSGKKGKTTPRKREQGKKR